MTYTMATTPRTIPSRTMDTTTIEHAALQRTLQHDDMPTLGSPDRYAWEVGAEHGVSAQSWIDLTGDDTARAYLTAIDEGDDNDILPRPDLSGQIADTLTGPQLVEDAMPDASDEERMDAFNDVCEAYETAFVYASEDALRGRCIAYLLG